MRTFVLAAVLGILMVNPAVAQTSQDPKFTIRDLDFLIGAWEITTDHYNPRTPGLGVELQETGIMTCEYCVPFNGEPVFIVCEHVLKGSNGWERIVLHYFRYSRFKEAFEFAGMFSNWPAFARGTLILHAGERMLELRSELNVRNALERGEDIYTFSEDFSSFKIEGVSNFSDSRVSQFHPVFTTVGKKISQ